MNNKKYINQKQLISEIRNKTGHSADDISQILNTLGDVVKDSFSNPDKYVEIKLFPGLKITARYLTPEQSKSNFTMDNCGFVLRLGATFSDYFKKEVRTLHQDNL